jgi:hypothetical protein
MRCSCGSRPLPQRTCAQTPAMSKPRNVTKAIHSRRRAAVDNLACFSWHPTERLGLVTVTQRPAPPLLLAHATRLGPLMPSALQGALRAVRLPRARQR